MNPFEDNKPISPRWKEYKVTKVWNTKSGFGCFAMDTELGESVSLKGTQSKAIQKGDIIHCSVMQDSDKKYFANKPLYEAIECLPEFKTKRDFINYFSSDIFRQIGPKTAEEIYDTLGINALYKLKKDKSVINQVDISARKKINLFHTIDSSILLDKILSHYPFLSQNTVKSLLKIYHDDCDRILNSLSKNAYDLIKYVAGFTLKIADKVSEQNGLDSHNFNRIEYVMATSLKKTLRENLHGSTYLVLTSSINYSYWMMNASNTTKTIDGWELSAHELGMLVPKMEHSKKLYKFMIGSVPCMTLESYYANEKYINKWVNIQLRKQPLIDATLSEILNLIKDYMDETGSQLDETQQSAVVYALRSPLSIITGGPGRGKTTVAACIAWIFDKCKSNRETIALTSFTGKATKRLESSVKDTYSGDLVVATMLKFVYTVANRGSNEPFDKKDAIKIKIPSLVIIDEASMIDINVMADFLRILENHQVVIMGDSNQLPPVGPGQVLKDLVDSKIIPITKLEKCYRASSKLLIDNADAILEDRFSDIVFDDRRFVWDNFEYVGFTVIDNIAAEYLKLINQGCDKSDVAILAAFKSEKDPLSVQNLNIKIHNDLLDKLGNPISALKYGSGNNCIEMCVGDRVVMTKNNSDAEIFNGDTGVIMSFDADSVTVLTDLGLEVSLPFDSKEKDNGAKALELAYAITVHKSQGSEYSRVIIGVSHRLGLKWATDSGFSSKNLLYTAITRSKNSVKFFGSKEGFKSCLTTPLPNRDTYLRQILK